MINSYICSTHITYSRFCHGILMRHSKYTKKASITHLHPHGFRFFYVLNNEKLGMFTKGF